MHLAGWLLLACFFVPVAEGCDGKSTVPANILDNPAPLDLASTLVIVAVIGAYANGVVWGIVTLVSGAFRSQRIFWAAFGLQCGLTLFGMLSLLVIESIQGTWRDLLEVFVNCFPMVVYLSICVILPLRRRQFLLAWTRFQQAWLLGVLVWMNLICIFSRTLKWGYPITWLASGLMFVAILVGSGRIEHDLWNSNAPVNKLQFSIRQTLIWTTSLAIVIAYYQLISKVMSQ